jgi:RHS repeat-associated protein
VRRDVLGPDTEHDLPARKRFEPRTKRVGHLDPEGTGVDDPMMSMGYTLGTGWYEYYYITDGQGRQLAVGDTNGVLSIADQTSVGRKGWQWAGGTQNSASYKASRMSMYDLPQISFFRNRVYDQRSGRWTQEDPIGVAGGLNLYQFNGNNPVTFSDPFGLCPQDKPPSPCKVYLTAYGREHRANLDALKPAAREGVQRLADDAGHDIGVNATTNGDHCDLRHNGKTGPQCTPQRSAPELSGLAVDIGEVDGKAVGTPEAAAGVKDVEASARKDPSTKTVIDYDGYWSASKPGGDKLTINSPGVVADHDTHMHVSWW